VKNSRAAGLSETECREPATVIVKGNKGGSARSETDPSTTGEGLNVSSGGVNISSTSFGLPNPYTDKLDFSIDPNNTGNVSWQAPTGAFDAATLSNGTQTAAANLYAIKAVRIGLILRTSLPERAQQYVTSASATTATGVVSPGPLVLFADVPGLAYTRKLAGGEQNYRYRVLEATIPLRNTLLQR